MVRWYGHVRRMNEDRLPNFRDENRRKIKAREKTEDSDGKILPKSYHNPSLIDNNHRLKMPGDKRHVCTVRVTLVLPMSQLRFRLELQIKVFYSPQFTLVREETS
uniref:Uncharacterized protein n=1 Tax=Cacopsylla melanoneura TaxID=428564 RepID=A0A8D9E6C0_9HEMI